MKLLRKSLPFLVLAASVLTLSGCGTNGDDSVARYAADSATTADLVSSLSILFTDSVSLKMAVLSSEVAANAAFAGTSAKLTAGCLKASIDGRIVTFTAQKCEGPKYGLKNLDGELTATYTVTDTAAPHTVKVDLSGNDISVNRATINIHASSDITIAGNGLTATVTSNNTEATVLQGKKLTQTGIYIAEWDGMCTTLNTSPNRSFMTHDDGILRWKTEIDGYKRCLIACPARGGSIALTGLLVTRLSFTGNNLADKTINTGPSSTFALVCP